MTIQQYEERAGATLATTQDVAVQRLGEWAQSADAAYQVAERLSSSAFVPAQFKGKPVELTAAILSGLEVGLSPMAAMRSFDIISGQAAPRAITLRAVVQSHGHEMTLIESTNSRCRMRGRRRGSEDWQTVTWTIERAQQLGLTSKDNWRKQPAAMLLARATSELARLIASDAILGIGYSSEEVADGGSYDQQVDAVTATPSAPSGTRRMSRPKRDDDPTNSGAEDEVQASSLPGSASVVEASGSPSAPESDPDVHDAEVVEDGITPAQLKKLGVLCREHNLTDRQAALERVTEIVGRLITTRNDLTKAEATTVIDRLQADLEQPFEEPAS